MDISMNNAVVCVNKTIENNDPKIQSPSTPALDMPKRSANKDQSKLITQNVFASECSSETNLSENNGDINHNEWMEMDNSLIKNKYLFESHPSSPSNHISHLNPFVPLNHSKNSLTTTMEPIIVSMTGPKTPSHLKSEMITNQDENIRVFVRCRPLKPTEKNNVIEVMSDRKEIRVNERSTLGIADRFPSKTFTFDNTFSADTPQIEVYRSVVSPLIEQVVMGYNCTVFAYGQTGTGKTYTMEGERSTDNSQWENDPSCGIIPRALHQLFETLQSHNTEHTVRVSFLQLYNEQLYDLLSPIDDTTKLKIYEDAARKGSTIVGALEEITVHTKAEIYDILKKGSAKRQTAATLLNACSSRSHTIFSVTVHIKENSLDGELIKTGKLNLVDLAGSENIVRSGAVEKKAHEAGNINQSLLTLERVITCLVEKSPHVPYHESKLTRLLQDSLGGRTKTSIIATISPNITDVEDTLSTLNYAHCANTIINKPEINQKMSKKTLLREYTAEISRLRSDLAACIEKNRFFINENNNNLMQEQIKCQNDIKEKCAQIHALKEEIEKVKNLFEQTKQQLQSKTMELEQTNQTLAHTQQTLVQVKHHCDEQKHLVGIHVSNQKTLSSQAKELLSIADQMTNDVQKLHLKVNRQKNVEVTNKTKIEDFQKIFYNEMKKLEDLVHIITGSYHDNLTQMQEAVQYKFDVIDKVITQMRENVSLYGNTFEGKSGQLSLLHTKDRIVHEQAIELRGKSDKLNTKSAIIYDQMSTMAENGQQTMNEQIQVISSIVAKQRLEIKELVMQQNAHMNTINEMRVFAFDNFKNQMKQIFETQKNEILSFKTEMSRVMRERNETKHSMNQKCNEMEKLFKVLNDIKVLQIKDHAGFIMSSKGIITKINGVVKSNHEQSMVLTDTIHSVNVKNEAQDKYGIDFIDKVDHMSTKNTQQIMNQCSIIHLKTQESADELNKSINDGKQQMISDIHQNTLINDDMIKMIDKQLMDKHNAMEQMRNELTEKLTAQNVLIDESQKEIKETINFVNDKTNNMVRFASIMDQSQRREIQNTSKSFETFVKYELIKDIPSGMTPQNTDYQYPRHLIETSPHERILRRYRVALDPNQAINAPLPKESDSEFGSSFDSCISESESDNIGSINGNNENIPIPQMPPQKNVPKATIGAKIIK